MNLKTLVVSVAVGSLIGVSMWFFMDGVVTSADGFVGTHIIPVLLSLISLVFLNLLSPSSVTRNPSAKLWIIFWLSAAMISVGISVWITAVEYPKAEFAWPGQTLIIQSSLMLCASLLLFMGRIGLGNSSLFD